MKSNRLWDRCVRSTLVLLVAPLFSAAQEAPAPPPQIAISPPRFELEIGPQPTTESIRIINMGDEPVEIQVSVANWDLDENSQVRVVEPTEQSLDQWMIINPLRFTIPPRETQNVRFSIRPRVEPEEGEHRAMIYLDQILPKADAGSGIRIRFQYGVAIYGHVGEKARLGTLHGIEVNAVPGGVTASFDISSDGNSHVRMTGHYAIWPAVGFPGVETTEMIADKSPFPAEVIHAGQLPSLPVLPGYQRQLTSGVTLALAPGNYVFDVNGELSGELLDMAIPFTVPEPTPEPAPDPVPEPTLEP